MTELELSPWTAQVITLFPEMFPGSLGYSIIGRALENKRWALQTVALRDFAIDQHNTVDDSPYGGGPGMVLRPDVLDGALRSVYQGDKQPDKLIYLTPKGKPLTQGIVKQLANKKKVAIICGRFEGVDQRVLEAWNVEELSLGDFVLAGAEVAAMAVIEACVRLLPGVVNTEESLQDESFADGLLEYPHYTRPRIWQEREVPDILLSGNHAKIAQWRLEQAQAITRQRRPDLWQDYAERMIQGHEGQKSKGEW